MSKVIELAGKAFETPGTEPAFRNGFWTVTNGELERFYTIACADISKAHEIHKEATGKVVESLEAENAKLRDVFDELLTNIDHATSCGAWNVQAGSQTHETIEAARAIIAAHTAKLRQGVELPEGLPAMKWQNTMFTREQLQQYGDQRDQAGYLRGLETALLKVTGLSVDAERCKQLQLTTQAWEEALDAAAAAIQKLKGGE